MQVQPPDPQVQTWASATPSQQEPRRSRNSTPSELAGRELRVQLQPPSPVQDPGVSATYTLRGQGRPPDPSTRKPTRVFSSCLASHCSRHRLPYHSRVQPSSGAITVWHSLHTLGSVLASQCPAAPAPSRIWVPMRVAGKAEGSSEDCSVLACRCLLVPTAREPGTAEGRQAPGWKWMGCQ